MTRPSYDPDEKPEISQALIDEARKLGMQPVHVICDQEGAKVGESGGVSFWSITPFLPRVGEHIWLSDGGRCTVKSVIWRVTTDQDSGSTYLFPNVLAYFEK
jgi:hypothetical protein